MIVDGLIAESGICDLPTVPGSFEFNMAETP